MKTILFGIRSVVHCLAFPGLSADGKSTGTRDSSSFSCLQLSGVTQEHDSKSLRIDVPQDNIIPSSPDVMHIDLSATPSLKQGSGDGKNMLTTGDGDNFNNDKVCLW